MRRIARVAFQRVNGLPNIGARAGDAALLDNIPCATFTLAALGRYTQFKLNLVKTHSGAGVAGDVAIRNSAANANNHGYTVRNVDSVATCAIAGDLLAKK